MKSDDDWFGWVLFPLAMVVLVVGLLAGMHQCMGSITIHVEQVSK